MILHFLRKDLLDTPTREKADLLATKEKSVKSQFCFTHRLHKNYNPGEKQG